MEIILKYLDPVIRIISFFALPFLCGGLIQKIRSYSQGRKGAPILQILYDTWRMIRKKPVDGPFSGFFTEASPLIAFLAGLVVWSLASFEWGSFLLIPFLIGVMRFALLAYSVENGTSFAGMGAAREIILYVFCEPIMILVLVVFESHLVFNANFASLAFGGLFLLGTSLVILAELAKPPFDDPRTHLELTMVHEAMLLEASGSRRALFELAQQFKTSSLFLFVAKMGVYHGEFFLSRSVSPFWLDVVAILGALFVSVCVGYIEANSTRRKWLWIPELLGLNFIFMLFLGILLKLG
ncbi:MULTISPECIES: NADH-quinone oxidoreductase subunit H [Leptospira]|uniref:NADH-quinone oxidoreductase subunit H n=1 Tax=Leptospira TaxID=171 RepID=UPI0002487923|nr:MULTISPECIES: NADH-quinone oxidoreductase subunit H [Leptospira]EMN45756.1 putative membrane protein [Leptospira weilii str. LNT 1234]MCL8265243.1 NADH-quinone oxidoreductase subunit H [Leptospira weilii]MDL5245661.1 NADH-quinone oxidoreductase subunit H [Leptospira weilii]OMI17190.1 formate hydrogenase [Leptospira weilii serovar Heyan]QDK24562.1 formate hydrogenase [Leptospira weilii]